MARPGGGGHMFNIGVYRENVKKIFLSLKPLGLEP